MCFFCFPMSPVLQGFESEQINCDPQRYLYRPECTAGIVRSLIATSLLVLEPSGSFFIEAFTKTQSFWAADRSLAYRYFKFCLQFYPYPCPCCCVLNFRSHVPIDLSRVKSQVHEQQSPDDSREWYICWPHRGDIPVCLTSFFTL